MSDETTAPAFKVADHTIPQVLAEVDAGTITAEAALSQEEERGEEARSGLLAKLRAILNPPPPAAPPEVTTAKGAAKVMVRTNPKRGVKGAAYYDPESKVTIGEKPVNVTRSPFVTRLLLTGELVEV